MPALLIINYDVVDAVRLEAYREAATAALVGPGKGTLFANTDTTVDLGEGSAVGATTVILEYPSVEAAQNAVASAGYQAVIGERLAATNPAFAIIVPMSAGQPRP